MDVVTTARRARPHLIRAAVAGVITAGVFGAGIGFGEFQGAGLKTFDPKRLIAVACALGVALAGVVMVRALAAAVRAGVGDEGDGKRGAPLSLIVSVFGYFVVAVLILAVFQVQMGSLLLGGALTGVALGIAAQQTLGNFFAGILLLIVRPFTVGDRVFLKSGLGEYDGVVTEMGLFYMHMTTDRGTVALPNGAVIASAVGPGARPKATDDTATDKETAGEQEDPEKAADPSRRASEPA
jgi:small-conductance mechanosensitive channel